tara:strand:+ start:1798 stop:2013 length:216 start_codon:yes stop_codon:yes gene_type:complete
MRFTRAIIISLLMFFPGAIVGLFGWLATGASEDNTLPEVIFFCNIVPFGFIFVGFIWAWVTGEEYSHNYQG